MIGDTACAAVDLESFVSDIYDTLGGEQLRHRSQLRRLGRFAGLNDSFRAIGEAPSSFEACCHLGEFVPGRLELTNLLTELFTFVCVRPCFIQCYLGDTYGPCAHVGACREKSHQLMESLGARSDNVLNGHMEIVESDLCSIGRPNTELVIDGFSPVAGDIR